MEEKMISMSESVFDKLVSACLQAGQLIVAVKHYQELKPMTELFYLFNHGEALPSSIIEEHAEAFKKIFATIKEDQKYVEANSNIKLDIPDTFEEFERRAQEIKIPEAKHEG
jgi:histidinol phosphatase-like PHP family hydrolase